MAKPRAKYRGLSAQDSVAQSDAVLDQVQKLSMWVASTCGGYTLTDLDRLDTELWGVIKSYAKDKDAS